MEEIWKFVQEKTSL